MNKPCPFCGSGKIVFSWPGYPGCTPPTRLVCETCGTKGPILQLRDINKWEEAPQQLWDIWNTRI